MTVCMLGCIREWGGVGEAGQQHERVLVYGKNYMKVVTLTTLTFCNTKSRKAISRNSSINWEALDTRELLVINTY